MLVLTTLKVGKNNGPSGPWTTSSIVCFVAGIISEHVLTDIKFMCRGRIVHTSRYIYLKILLYPISYISCLLLGVFIMLGMSVGIIPRNPSFFPKCVHQAQIVNVSCLR